MVGVDEIEKNDYNLNLPRYIDASQAEDKQDIEGHLKGGIPAADVDALARYWAVCPKLGAALFKPNRAGYVDLAVDKAAIKATIFEHPEFKAFIAGINTHFATWREQSAAVLKTLEPGFHPKQLIERMSESLLYSFTGQPLLDPYDIYQHLMDYWAETMQDDAYLIAADGWQAETYRVIEKNKNGKEKDKGWACDLLPKAYIVGRYFAKEQAAIERLSTELDATAAKLAELEEEQGGEEGVFAGFDKVNAAVVKDRIREVGADDTAIEELAVLKQWLQLAADEATLKKQLREAEVELDAKAYARYPRLGEAEIKALVVDDKWFAALDVAIHGELERVSQTLSRRVKELAERYEAPLPQLTERVADLEARVSRHLEKMGFAWK
jgi:type I restriction enzyme M protein